MTRIALLSYLIFSGLLTGCVTIVVEAEPVMVENQITTESTDNIATPPANPLPPVEVSLPPEPPPPRVVVESCDIPSPLIPAIIPEIDQELQPASVIETENILIEHIQELRQYILDRDTLYFDYHQRVREVCR